MKYLNTEDTESFFDTEKINIRLPCLSSLSNFFNTT